MMDYPLLRVAKLLGGGHLSYENLFAEERLAMALLWQLLVRVHDIVD